MKFSFKSSGRPVPEAWKRLNFSWIMTAYFLFIAVSSIAQIGLHAQLYVSDNKALSFISNIVSSWKVGSGSLPILGSNRSVHLCTSIPAGFSGDTCRVVYDPSGSSNDPSTHAAGGGTGVSNQACLLSLNYPVSVLSNSLREDAILIGLHIAIWGLGLTALFKRSIPHFLAALVAQAAAVILAAIRLSGTMNFHDVYENTIMKGACSGLNMLPSFFGPRWALEVASLVLDVLALVAACFLTWRLIKDLDFHSLKAAGQGHSKYTNKIYKVFIAFSTTIQLSMFFQILTLIVWVDQEFRIGQVARLALGSKVVYILAAVLSVPWLLSGWIAVRQEKWKTLLAFLGISFIFLALWSLTFAMMSFQFTITTWPVFAFMAVFSFLLNITLFVTGVICAVNYGKGVNEIRAVHESPAHSRTNSVSSMEKPPMSWDVERGQEDAIEQPVPLHAQAFAAPQPVSAYAHHQKNKPSMGKARAAAQARGLQVTPPPLN